MGFIVALSSFQRAGDGASNQGGQSSVVGGGQQSHSVLIGPVRETPCNAQDRKLCTLLGLAKVLFATATKPHTLSQASLFFSSHKPRSPRNSGRIFRVDPGSLLRT